MNPAAQRAAARALSHVKPAEPDPWGGVWPPPPAAWQRRCRQIREEIDRERAARKQTANRGDHYA